MPRDSLSSIRSRVVPAEGNWSKGQEMALRGRRGPLSLSNKLFERFAETAPSIVYILNLDTQRLEYLNATGLQIIEGHEGSSHALLSELVSLFVHPDDQRQVLQHFQNASSLPMKGRASTEFRIRHRDGSYHWYVDCHAPSKRTEQGRVTQIVGIQNDVSWRHEAVLALEKSEGRIRVMADTVQAVLFETDPDGRVKFCNKAFLEFCGSDAGKIHGRRWQKFVHRDDLRRLTRMMSNDRPVDGEARLKGMDGVYRWFLVRARPLQNSDGTVNSWFGSATDIEDLKRAHADLERANRRLQMTVSAISDGYLTLDRSYIVTALNEHAANWLLSSQETMVGHSILSKLRWNVDEFRKDIDQVVTACVPTIKEVRSFIHRDRWVQLAIHPTDEGVAIFFQDVTDRKASEAAMKNSLQLLQHSIDALSAHIAVLDETGRILAVNRAWRSYYAVRGGFVLPGGTCLAVYENLPNEGDINAIGKGLKSVLAGQKHDYHHVFECDVSSGQWLQLRASRFQVGGRRHVIVAHEDISAVKNLEEERRRTSHQLLKTQNTERQRIARELHDSTAQHITAIGLGLGRLKMHVTDAAAETVLADMSQSLQEAHNELRSMTYLLHPPEIEGGNVVASLEKFIDGFAARTRLTIRLDSPPEMLILPEEKRLAFYRVVQEALVNASRHARAKNVVVRLRQTRHAVRLEVKDDGVGLPPESLNDGKTSGLGIPGMRARMEEFGGSLRIDRLTGGTKVQAVMPIDNPRQGSIK